MKTLQKEKLYTVQEVAQMYGITKHTIRFYTDKGLSRLSGMKIITGYLIRNV